MRSKDALIGLLARILPERVKTALFHLSFNLANDEFLRFAHAYAFAPNMKLGLHGLAERGFEPKTIIDVGAFEGAWSTMVREIWPHSHIIMFEPNLRELTRLAAQHASAKLFGELLGANDGEGVDFHIMGSGSSILSERSPLSRTTERRRLRTLDSVLSDVSSGLLKIDAQGYEIEILKGATKTLRDVDGVLLEVSLIEINEGAPILHDVIAFMRSVGFVAYDILEFHRRPLDNALHQIDLLFVRPNSGLLEDKRHYASAK
jgi:FkbM family methyltransferase